MRWIMRLFAGIGLLVVLVFGAMLFAFSRLHISGHAPATVAESSILTLTVEGPFVEEPAGATGLSVLSGHGRKLRETVAAIDHAADDHRIKGLVIKIDGSAGLAQTQELRGAIGRFRQGGKFVYAFADEYGDSGSGNGAYYLAAACDQVWMQPMGDVVVTGVAFETPFIKDALAKFDVEPEFVKRSEYKNAPETFTERGYSPAAREMMEGLANDLTTQLAAGLADSRKLSGEQVRAIFARGPMTGDEAVEARMIDRIGYADEVVAAARKAGGDAKTLTLSDYYDQTVGRVNTGKTNIALIYAVGEIGQVQGPIEPGEDEDGVRGNSAIARGFAKAIADSDVKTIVFRVDSPGGSVSGSEAIRRMVVRAKAAGKKLVVSMGATAASGGYWISADADKIVADPASLTGSIGVFSGKFVLGKGLADYGVTTDRTADSGFATMNSPFIPFTPEQTARLNATIDAVYDGFVARVAQGRKLPPATVAQSAKGRVWTGQQAKQLGLVDEVGGLSDAVRLAREIGGIPATEATHIRVYPEPKSGLEAVRDFLGGNVASGDDASSLLAELNGPASTILKTLAPLFGNPSDHALRMPELGVPK